MKQLLLDISPIPLQTLDNFVAGRNEELLHVLRAVVGQREGAERFVYLWGVPGAGRTHLLRGAVQGAKAQGLEAAYVTAAELGNANIDDLARCQVVALDDVEQLGEDAQIKAFDLYNRLRDADGVLLAAGACAPAQLVLRDDVVTRFGWGLVYQVHMLTDQEKPAALRIHARERGFDLAEEVIAYLLRHWRRDLPSLVAVLDALDRYSLQTKRPITVPLMREIIQAPLEF
jgi:DnaA family protein